LKLAGSLAAGAAVGGAAVAGTQPTTGPTVTETVTTTITEQGMPATTVVEQLVQPPWEDVLIKKTVRVAENMEPVIPHPEHEKEVQNKLAALEKRFGKKPFK